MSNLLFDYIQNVLAPKEYKLELKNRLENLCSLSGQTMSPGLTKWLEKTFGIEMVRVIQDYATLGGNKFPPDYFEKIKRLVPGNYKGYDANQGFKQLFDVECSSKCLYFAKDIITNTACGWGGFYWSINNTIYPTLGGIAEVGVDIQNQYQPEAGGGIGLNGCDGFLWSLENDPIGTNWEVMTSDTYVNNPVQWYCIMCNPTFGCYDVTINYPSTSSVYRFGIWFLCNGLLEDYTLWQYTYQLSDPDFATMLQSVFGGQATITVTDNGTSVYIKIENCYNEFRPRYIEIITPQNTLVSYNFTSCTP